MGDLSIVVCVGSSCYVRGSERLAETLDALVRERGLAARVEVSGAFCMDQCSMGVSVRVGDSVTVDRLRDVKTVHDLPNDQDGATRLARELLYADEVHFIVGDAINLQQLADVVRGVPMREIYLDELIAKLRERNKTVTVEHL